MEEGEGCDALDSIDEDGCNVDCTVSGSLLWSWDPGQDVILRVGFDPSDELHVLVRIAGEGLEVRRFDASGEVAEVFDASPVERPPGTPEDAPATPVDEDLKVADDAVYVGLHQYWQSGAEFFVAGHVERLGEAGWVRAVEGGVRAVEPRTQGGVVAGSVDGFLHAFDADGTEAWVVDTDLGLLPDILSADGAIVVISASRIAAFDEASGDELWSFGRPDGTFRFSGIGRSATEIWLTSNRFPVIDETSIFRFDFGGALLEQIDAPDMGFWHEMTESGNVVWQRRQGVGEPILIEKLDANLDVLWFHEFGTSQGWRHLVVDGRGTVAAAKLSELRVLAP